MVLIPIDHQGFSWLGALVSERVALSMLFATRMLQVLVIQEVVPKAHRHISVKMVIEY